MITFDSRQWDKTVTGEHSYGWLTREVFHEFVHVMQNEGLFGMKNISYNLDEFQANYLSVINKNLPSYNQSETNFYSGKAIGYLANAPDGASLIKQNAISVQTLLNMVPPDV